MHMPLRVMNDYPNMLSEYDADEIKKWCINYRIVQIDKVSEKL